MRLLYLDIDTLRPDHLSCYGYNRPTSPSIDRLCAESVRFDNCHVADAPCLPSRAAGLARQGSYYRARFRQTWKRAHLATALRCQAELRR